MSVALWVIAVASAAWWLLQLSAALRTVHSVPRIAPDQDAWSPPDGVTVSVICPARNEADELEAAMRTRLSDPAPWLEFIAVNDRSTDATGEIFDALAAQDDRLTVVHLTDCPEGWLGKVHAQCRGIDAATGEWFVFSDADTHVEPGMVAAALAHLHDERADVLGLLPRIVDGPWLLRAALPAMMRMLIGALRLWEANDDAKDRVMGVGAFNLVSRSTLDRAGGMAALRMEVADDVGLAHIVREAGGRARLASAPEGVWIRWYRTVGDLLRGTEKGVAKAGSRGKLVFGLSIAWVLLVCELAPFTLWWFWPATPAIVASIVGGLAIIVSLRLAVGCRLPVLWSLLPPLSTLCAAMLSIRAVVLALCRGGIRWKGDAHTLKAARDGERVQL